MIRSYASQGLALPPRRDEVARRDFNAASMTRLTSDWTAGITSADSELRTNIKTLRARCRDLERNNDYVRRYLKLLENNVLGSSGVQLQMKIKELRRKGDKVIEQYDELANSIIEWAWWEWNKAKHCHRGGKLCWVDLCRLALRSVARDGALLIRKHWTGDYHFQIEPIEIDQLDTDHNATVGDGGVIRLGVRYAASGEIVSYFITRQHPGELFQPKANGYWREEVPANQILHLFMPERVGQSTGYPWLVSAVMRLRHLGAYEEAEVVAARMGAAKMGFLEPDSTATGGYSGPTDGNGNKYMDVEPGSIEQLPYGYKFKEFNPSHPNGAFKDFVKATLRGISAGLGVSYTSLANDLESVNYSSIRAGLLEEREEWKTIQAWFINWFVQPIFDEWLTMAATFGMLKNNDNGPALPAGKLSKFNRPEWKARRWGWVDPLADLQADVLAVEKGFKSRRELISERGGDIEDVFSDIAADEDLAEQKGLEFGESSEEANKQPSRPDKPDDPKAALTEEED